MTFKFDDMTDDDSFDASSDIDPEAVGRIFGVILLNLIHDREQLTLREKVWLAFALLVARLEREGTIG